MLPAVCPFEVHIAASTGPTTSNVFPTSALRFMPTTSWNMSGYGEHTTNASFGDSRKKIVIYCGKPFVSIE